MKITFTLKGRKSYISLPPKIMSITDKQLNLLINDFRHPSLRAKKYDERQDIWQGRITGIWRFYFLIEHDEYVILSIIKHPN